MTLTGPPKLAKNKTNFRRPRSAPDHFRRILMSILLRSLAGALALGWSLGPASAYAQAPIKIGASLSLTGTYAKPGTYQKEGYEICTDEVNTKGGVVGRKMELVL